MKWSYRKVIFSSALVLLCCSWLVVYVNTITKRATTVMSPALTAYALIAAVVFALIVVLVVRYNLSVYPKRFAEWNRAFICQRCGSYHVAGTKADRSSGGRYFVEDGRRSREALIESVSLLESFKGFQ